MVMMSKPSVSVVVPLYNKAEFILNTLSAAASQIATEFEIIVVDDGSTDGSGELVKKAGLPHLQLIKQANAGVSVARNRAIAVAQGKWIALLDADDLWSYDHLAGLIDAVEGSDVIAAFSNLRLQSRSGRPLVHPKVSAQKVDDYFSFALANGGYTMQTSATLVLRNQMLEAGLFAEGLSIGEDIDMWCRLACRGPFFYTAKLSAAYNDARSPTRRSERGRIVRPFFAQRLPDLIRDGKVPPALIESSRRYANFLMLEYARQLLDAGEYAEARTVLLNECVVGYDSTRFLKRLARTSSVGRAIFRLTRVRPNRADARGP
jgi:glycosyltransferase involved in cell wall biosynthesis